MKICTKCQAEKSLSSFHKRKASLDGLQPRCIDCTNAYTKEQYQNKKEDRLRNKREYYAANKERVIAYNAERYRSKKPEILAQMAEYYKENREERLGYQKRTAAEQRRKHKVRMNSYAASRRAKQVQATPTWADKDKITEFYKAADFLGMATGEWYHVDHIVPLQSKIVCGLHCEANLQVLPGSENQAKGNRRWPGMP